MFNYYLYKIGRFLSTRLSSRSCYAIATILSITKYYVSPRDRHAVINNLRQILPSSEHPKIRKYAKEVFVNFGKYLIEFLRFSLLKKEELSRLITVKGLENIEKSLGKGKGVIVLTAHMGNWELGGVFMSLLGFPMIAVALPHSHRKVNTFFNRQRERSGVTVVPSLGMAIRRIYSALHNNKIVAMVSDRDFTNSGRKMNFLGAQKVIPRGPAILTLRTGAPIVPGFVVKQKDETYCLEFQEPIGCEGSEEQIMLSYAGILETMIRRYPTQWLLFREFWKE